jgi:hypothetical protein
MTAKEELDTFRARSQLLVTLVGLAIYFLAVLVFVFVMHRIEPDQRLTIAVLLLTPLPGLINSAAAFWLNRSRDDGAEKPPTITSTATPGSASTVITPAGNAPPPDNAAPVNTGGSAALSPHTDGDLK